MLGSRLMRGSISCPISRYLANLTWGTPRWWDDLAHACLNIDGEVDTPSPRPCCARVGLPVRADRSGGSYWGSKPSFDSMPSSESQAKRRSNNFSPSCTGKGMRDNPGMSTQSTPPASGKRPSTNHAALLPVILEEVLRQRGDQDDRLEYQRRVAWLFSACSCPVRVWPRFGC